jgi:endonuclease III-like uncharacterized protein
LLIKLKVFAFRRKVLVVKLYKKRVFIKDYLIFIPNDKINERNLQSTLNKHGFPIKKQLTHANVDLKIKDKTRKKTVYFDSCIQLHTKHITTILS